MKKLYSTVMMLALMVAALSFTACGGDDGNDVDNGGGSGYDSSDFIEISVDGDNYHKKLSGIYLGFSLTGTGMVLLPTTETLFDEEGFRFYITLALYEKADRVLSCSTGEYGVVEHFDIGGTPDNFCMCPIYKIDNKQYKLLDGTHTVTSIKKANNGKVQVCGTFDLSLYRNDDYTQIKGKYAMTVL